LVSAGPDPARGAYSTPIDFVAVFKGRTSKGTEREEGWKGMEGEKARKKREGEELERGAEERRKGEKEMGRDLPDHCQTTSYTRL